MYLSTSQKAEEREMHLLPVTLNVVVLCPVPTLLLAEQA